MGIHNTCLKVNDASRGVKLKGVRIKSLDCYLKIALCHTHDCVDFASVAHFVCKFVECKCLFDLCFVLLFSLFFTLIESIIPKGRIRKFHGLLGAFKYLFRKLDVSLLCFKFRYLPTFTRPYEPTRRRVITNLPLVLVNEEFCHSGIVISLGLERDAEIFLRRACRIVFKGISACNFLHFLVGKWLGKGIAVNLIKDSFYFRRSESATKQQGRMLEKCAVSAIPVTHIGKLRSTLHGREVFGIWG